jgi:hypothetical protein
MDKKFVGEVTPPADMMDAARRSLPDDAFHALMEQTGGAPPTPDELCRMVDSVRQAMH